MPNTKVVGIIFPYILTPIPNLYDHSFPRYGQITFLTFRRPTTLTFDLKFWKYLSVTVYPYVICMPSFIMIGWEMAEILHFEILRKHGQTHKQTDRQTWALQYLALPLRGRGNNRQRKLLIKLLIIYMEVGMHARRVWPPYIISTCVNDFIINKLPYHYEIIPSYRQQGPILFSQIGKWISIDG